MSRIIKFFRKDPEEVLDYTINWSRILDGNETIEDSTWEIESSEETPTLAQNMANFSGTAASIWVSGGTHGVDYFAVNRVTTSAARVYERGIKIIVKNTEAS